jgi:hypothetical protein
MEKISNGDGGGGGEGGGRGGRGWVHIDNVK